MHAENTAICPLLSNEEIIRIYGKRWNIKVFFKTTKTCLRLAKEFQGRSYDSMVAHTTIVFCRYIMLLAMESRNNDDVRTVGELFYLCCDELRDITFSRSISLLMEILKEIPLTNLLLPERMVMNLFRPIYCFSAQSFQGSATDFHARTNES